MIRSLITLSLGTLILGISEFVMMGILPYVAAEFGVDIARAGHFVSAYAIGVCVGAPLLVFVRRQPVKRILMGLVLVIIAGNLLASAATGYWLMAAARFVSGLPHGAYFGAASIAASALAKEGKSAGAVSVMIAGMTIANVLGVPLGTAFSDAISWRVIFVLVGAFGLVVFFCILRWVPNVPNPPDTGLRGQFRFLKTRAPWVLMAAVMLGNGGIFCWYSYISPLLVEVSGFQKETVSLSMVLAGLGMVAGNLVGGFLSDRYKPSLVAGMMQLAGSISLVGIFLFAKIPAASVILMMFCTASLFAVSSPQQLLLLRFSKGGEMLGAAGAQVSFNIGNALGAFMGGLPISMGLGIKYSATVGAPFGFMGFLLLFYFFRRYESPKKQNLRLCPPVCE